MNPPPAEPARVAPAVADGYPLVEISGGQSARYTRDMLEALTRIALGHDQGVLAGLLEAAKREAERLARG